LETSNSVIDIRPVEFDPFAEPEITVSVHEAEALLKNISPVYETNPVEFDPFDGPEIELIAPATESQTEIWASCLIGDADASCAFNESFTIVLTGDFNKDAMFRALQDVVNMHQALKMTFSGDGTHICVFKNVTLDVDFHDISLKTAEQQEAYIKAYNKQYVLTPFDLINGPLFKTSLFKLSDKEHYLTFVVHHIVCDGWSIGIMMQDLSQLYSAYTKGEYINLPKGPLFTDYAIAETALSKSESFKETEDYWIKQFEGSEHTLNIPVDFPRPALRTYKSHREDYTLNSTLANGVKKLGKSTGSSFVTTLLAAFEVFFTTVNRAGRNNSGSACRRATRHR